MLPALTFKDVLQNAIVRDKKDPTASRLISIVFAYPGSPIWDDLGTNKVMLDARSGTAWDLYFAGAAFYGDSGGDAVLLKQWDSNPFALWYSPKSFGSIERKILREVATSGVANESMNAHWRFSGTTDLVSFMAYSGNPDWSSLTWVSDLGSTQDLQLGAITETLARWREPGFSSPLAPGESGLTSDGNLLDYLVNGLALTAIQIATGIPHEAAHELVHRALS